MVWKDPSLAGSQSDSNLVDDDILGNTDEKNHDSDHHHRSANIEHQYKAIDPPFKNRYPLKQKSWHTRTRSPGLKWYKDYSKVDVRKGRVLVIDYVKWDHSKQGTRKVAAEEVYDLNDLKNKACQPSRQDNAVLRVFHVQNAPWAVGYLLHKFNISAENDLVGTDFGKYLKASKRQSTRGGKPFLSGKTWKTQHDPWRGVSKTAFGVDYMKCYPTQNPLRNPRRSMRSDTKMMELNCYDEEDNPTYEWDVHVQRVVCFLHFYTREYI